jgi:hypothetical protein
LWFSGARGGLIALLTRYLDDRIRRKLIAPVPDIGAAARLIIETTVFWAVHRHWDAHPERLDDATARETVLRFIVAALSTSRALVPSARRLVGTTRRATRRSKRGRRT